MNLKTLAAATLVALVFVPDTFAADASPKVGEMAPEFGEANWVMNAPEKRSLESMRGEVVLLEKWGVKCPPCVALIPHIEELQTTHGADGLNILAFEAQGHSAADIKAKLAEKGGKTYPVAAGGANKYETGGGIPHAWLIGVDGRVIWQGNPAGATAELDGLIATELGKVRSPKLGRTNLDKALSGAAGKFAKRDYTGARAEAEKVAAKESASETAKADAQFVIDRIAAIATRQAASAKQAEEEKRYLDAMDLYGSLAATLKGSPEGDAASARLKEIKGDDAAQKEIKAAEQLRKLCAMLEGKDAAVKKAELEKFAKNKKFEGTRAASDAQALADKG